MNFKERLESILSMYEISPELKKALLKLVLDADEQCKAIEFCMSEIAKTKVNLHSKDLMLNDACKTIREKNDEVLAFRKSITLQKESFKEIDSILEKDDGLLKSYIEEREKNKQLQAELSSTHESIKLEIKKRVLDSYVDICNSLYVQNIALATELNTLKNKKSLFFS